MLLRYIVHTKLIHTFTDPILLYLFINFIKLFLFFPFDKSCYWLLLLTKLIPFYQHYLIFIFLFDKNYYQLKLLTYQIMFKNVYKIIFVMILTYYYYLKASTDQVLSYVLSTLSNFYLHNKLLFVSTVLSMFSNSFYLMTNNCYHFYYLNTFADQKPTVLLVLSNRLSFFLFDKNCY